VLLPSSPHRRRLAIWIALTSLPAVLVMSAPASAARGATLLVSRVNGPSGAGGNGNSLVARISADGRFVAFESLADNLSPDDNDAVQNIFVRDIQTGTTTLVSRATGFAGAGGDANSSSPSISADGRFVAFDSDADNLSADDSNANSNVFVRDTQTGTTTLVGRANGPAGASADLGSYQSSISADGRFVAFTSAAINLSADDADPVEDVFVRDTQMGTTTLVSRATGFAGAGGDANSSTPSISADGRFVAFQSDADNLSTDDNNNVTNVFVRDTLMGRTTLVSRADGPAGAGGDGNSVTPSISADGGFVAFHSLADNLSAEDNDAFLNVFVRDTQTGTTTLVSRADGPAGVGADGNSTKPSISADGRFVAFQSNANNVSADDNKGFSDVFVRDTRMDMTTLVSRGNGPVVAGEDYDSNDPSMSADGRFVAFSSEASNLSADDDDGFTNVFRRDVRGGPPHCADVAQTVVRDSGTAVGLSCTDDDGDAMMLAIVNGPAHGVLGVIDQAARTVTYSPNGGAAGADTFIFQASDASGDSGAATARLMITGCSAAATFGSITCRLDDLVAAKAVGVPAGRLATKLERLLTQTRERLVAAEAAAALGRTRAVRKHLGKAAKTLGVFGQKLGTRPAKKLDPTTVAALRAAASALRDAVVALLRASG
jgi:Tol biopolymer transport system component